MRGREEFDPPDTVDTSPQPSPDDCSDVAAVLAGRNADRTPRDPFDLRLDDPLDADDDGRLEADVAVAVVAGVDVPRRRDDLPPEFPVVSVRLEVLAVVVLLVWCFLPLFFFLEEVEAVEAVVTDDLEDRPDLRRVGGELTRGKGTVSAHVSVVGVALVVVVLVVVVLVVVVVILISGSSRS